MLQTLSWDPVREHVPNLVIDEPGPCPNGDPPVTRCSRTPETATVADVRKRYGMVFELSFGQVNYYRVSKTGQVVRNGSQ